VFKSNKSGIYKNQRIRCCIFFLIISSFSLFAQKGSCKKGIIYKGEAPYAKMEASGGSGSIVSVQNQNGKKVLLLTPDPDLKFSLLLPLWASM